MGIKIKICDICDNEFETDYLQQKYCEKCGKDPDRIRNEYKRASSRLYELAGLDEIYKKPKKHICVTCGKEFVSPYKYSGNCSDSCKKAYRIKTAKCQECGAVLIEHGNNTGKGVCSEDCKQKQVSKREEIRISKAKISGDYINCKWCSKAFIRRGYVDFCSKRCSKLHDEENKVNGNSLV